MAFITADDGTELFFTDWGSGTPVVLIHGWPLNSDMWEQQATFLAEQSLRVIKYDRRGFGRSDQPWDGYDYNTLASDLKCLLEELDLNRAVLVGFSMGGGEVVRYLSRYGSERVAKAVLISAVTPFLQRSPTNPDGVDPKVFQDMEASIRKDRPAFLKEFGLKFYGRTMLSHTVSEAVLEWT
jgi:non-heme chloroperoxidase